MRAWRYDSFTSIDSLGLHEEAAPRPQRGELLLGVKAVALNYRDLAVLLGRYVQNATAGLVPASDAAAEVLAVGEGVTAYKPGDRVLGAFHPRWFGGEIPPDWVADSYGTGRDGWLCEQKVVSQEAVVPLPDGLSFAEGATLPCAAVTAWTALMGLTPLRAGQTVLTLGSGGVSIFALQVAKALGARVIATTGGPGKVNRLKALGADEVIDYRATPDWGAAVRALTGGRGADRVVEVGGPATVNQSLAAVARGGEVVLIGFLSSDNPGIDYFRLKGTGASVRAITVGDRAALAELARAVAVTGIKPVIDSVFPFAEAKEAFRHMESGRHVGKIVIEVG